MFCTQCGAENAQGAVYCSACGNRLFEETAPEMPTFAGALYNLAKTKLFFIATIALTVSAAESLLSGPSVGHIIAAIGFWLIWAATQKGNLAGYRAPLKVFEIFTKINYLLGKIGGIILMAVGGTASFIGLLIPIPSGPYHREVNVSGLDHDIEQVIEDFVSEFGEGPLIFILGVALTVAGLAMLLMAIIIDSRIKICANSALNVYQTGEGKVQYLAFTRIAILIFAITASIGATTNLSVNGISGTLDGVSAAAANVFLFLIVSELQKKLNATETN